MTINNSTLLKKCRSKNKSLTPQRLDILMALDETDHPLTAYDLKDQLHRNAINLNISTIYRVLDFWIKIGAIHKIESNNTYLICRDDHDNHLHVLQHCVTCDSVSETCELSNQFRIPKIKSFLVEPSQVIELKGQCSSCASDRRS